MKHWDAQAELSLSSIVSKGFRGWGGGGGGGEGVLSKMQKINAHITREFKQDFTPTRQAARFNFKGTYNNYLDFRCVCVCLFVLCAICRLAQSSKISDCQPGGPEFIPQPG